MSEGFFSPVLIWAVIGVVLLIAELVTFTFILSFLGLGALIVSLATWTSLTPGINSQLVVFAITSLLTMLLFRKTARKRFSGSHDFPPDHMGQTVKVVKAIPGGGEGTIVYRGSDWIAFSDFPDTISEGDSVEIIGIDGIRFKVKPLLNNK